MAMSMNAAAIPSALMQEATLDAMPAKLVATSTISGLA
jgi:hypothetical protein